MEPIRAWLCVERSPSGWRVLAGGPSVCLITGGAHTPWCGEKILLRPDSWALRVLPRGA